MGRMGEVRRLYVSFPLMMPKIFTVNKALSRPSYIISKVLEILFDRVRVRAAIPDPGTLEHLRATREKGNSIRSMSASNAQKEFKLPSPMHTEHPTALTNS